MNEYFFLAEKIKTGTAFAYTEEKTISAHELLADMKDKTELPFELVLKKVTPGKNGLLVSNDISGLKYLWLDYQPNNLAWPLMSEKMKNIVEINLTGKENIFWMRATVKLDNESRIYFIPRFEEKLDVLDERRTLFVQGTNHIVRPVFSLTKISNYNLFHKPQNFWEITSGLYVSEKLKLAMENEKLTGIDFEQTRLLNN